MKEPFGLDSDPDRLVTHCSDISVESPLFGVADIEVAIAQPFGQVGSNVMK